MTPLSGAKVYASKSPGVWVEDGRLHVALPHVYEDRLPKDEEIVPVALRLMATLRRYMEDPQRAVDEQNAEYVQTLGGEGACGALEAALKLWEDWRNHGVVPFNERQQSEHKPGRIDWERSRRLAPPTEDPGSIIFPRISRQRVEPVWNHPLQLLQLRTVHAISRMFHRRDDIPCPQLPAPPLSLLHDYGSRCFRDDQRRLADLLTRYYRHHQGHHHPEPIAGIKASTFWPVWERMCCVALGGEKPGTWETPYVMPDGSTQKGLVMRPDFVCCFNEKEYVVDCKYYKDNDLPGEYDILKQKSYWLYYFFERRKEMIKINIETLFLFPSNTTSVRAKILNSLPIIVSLNIDFNQIQLVYLKSIDSKNILKEIISFLK